jgi:phage-related protein
MPLAPPQPKKAQAAPVAQRKPAARAHGPVTALRADEAAATPALPSWRALARTPAAEAAEPVVEPGVVPTGEPVGETEAVAAAAAVTGEPMRPEGPEQEAAETDVKSAVASALVGGAAEGKAGALNAGERREAEAEAAQDRREGRVATAEDKQAEAAPEERATQERASAEAAEATEKARQTATDKSAPATPPLMRRAQAARAPPDDAVHDAIAHSQGHPLPAAIVDAYRQAWGQDFDSVVVHADEGAARAAQLLGAEAFACAEHLYFDHGRYTPGSPTGSVLLAHELAHVVQYRSGVLARAPPISSPGDAAESAADAYVARMPAPSPLQPGDLASHGARGPPAPVATAPLLRRATDSARAFFSQGYFQQAAGWSSATASMDGELAADAAQDTEAVPDPTATLGPQQAPEPPAPKIAPALTLEGEIPLPDAEATAAAPVAAEAEATPPSLPAPPALAPGADGDTSAMEARFDQAVAQIPTEFAVETSPGEAPPVTLDGAADPAQSVDQQEAANAQAAALQAQATAAVDAGPGPEQVQPGSLHETYDVVSPEAGTLEPLPEIAEMTRLAAAPIPEDVRAETDAQGQEQLTATLAEAQTQFETADVDHETARTAEVERARSEQAELNAEAEDSQDSEVERGRGEIDGARAETRQAQADAVVELEGQAETERTTLEGEIDARVQEDEQAIDDEYLQAETDAQAELDSAEAQAEEKQQEAEQQSEEQSWWESALDAISSFFDALLDFVNQLFDALIAAVGAIIEAAKAAVSAIIAAVRDFAIALVQAYGELLKGLVDALLGDLFPELAAALTAAIDAAVEAVTAAIQWIADTLEAGLHALLDSIGAALTALLEAYRAAINAALQLAQAALSGDWAALAKMVISAALMLIGIDPESFFQVIATAMGAIDIIVDDPGAFVGHVIDGVALGFQTFADNILQHLQTGFFEWIVGPLGELGITLPTSWDFLGIFGLVMQVLGLTQAGIRQVIVEELGETAGAIFDFVWRYVAALIEGGLQGLWEQIQNDLSMLWDTVVEGIKSYLIETIVTQAVIRIATMFNPAGALVQALLTVWNVYQWLRENAARIWGIVEAVVNMMASLAAGNIQPAAAAIEQALAGLIPIAISLLANLLGLGGITDKVREVLEGLRETVRNAIRSLIQRVKALFTGAPAEEEAEEEEAPEGMAAQFSQAPFEAAGPTGELESHNVYYEISGTQAVMMVASGGGAPLATAVSSGEVAVVDGPAEQQALSSVGPGESAASQALAAESPENAASATAAGQQQLTQAASALQQGGSFPEPIGGPHQRTGPTPPDNEPRQSHHVPGKALGRAIGGMLSDIATRLDGGTWAGNADALALRNTLTQEATEAESTAGGEGVGLSAILLRRDTHKQEVHGTASAAPVLTSLASNPGANEIVVVMRRTANRLGNFVAVNPRVSNWRDFLAACHVAISTGEIPESVITEQDAAMVLATAEAEMLAAEEGEEVQLVGVVTQINTIRDRAVNDAYRAGKQVVTQGLENNAEKEGTPAGRAQALADMDSTFGTSWTPLAGPITVAWP